MPRRLTVRITNKPTSKLRTTRTLGRPEDVFGSGTDHAAARRSTWGGVCRDRRSDRRLGTLHGVVERAYQKSCAEATVRRVRGVTGVRIEVAVRAAQEFSRLNLPPNLDWRFGAE